MRKVLKYQKLAKDFRKRAADASTEKDKEALLRLAASWDMLATTRQMQIEKGLDGCGAVVAQTFYSRPHPSKAAIADHLDRLLQRLAAIGERAHDADAVEEVVCRSGRAIGCKRSARRKKRYCDQQ